jgi:hypothetical protein
MNVVVTRATQRDCFLKILLAKAVLVSIVHLAKKKKCLIYTYNEIL